MTDEEIRQQLIEVEHRVLKSIREDVESRRETANEISQELARRVGAKESMLIRAFRLWIKKTYLDSQNDRRVARTD